MPVLALSGIARSSFAVFAFTWAAFAIPTFSFSLSGIPWASLPMSTLSRSAQLPKRTAQGFDFLLVRILLPLRQFEGFQHFFHFIEGCFQGLDDLVHVLDGFLN